MSRGSRRLTLSRLRRFIGKLVRVIPSPRDEALLAMMQAGLDFVRGREPLRRTTSEDHDWPVHLGYLRRMGWLAVDTYERIGMHSAQELRRHELDAWFAYARKKTRDLKPWPGLPADYPNDNNRLRFRRTADFVRKGDRVFDVGFGKGYLCGLLLRESRASAYHGVDVVESYLPIVRGMIEVNDFGDRDVELSIADLFDLTPEMVARSRPSLMICCEVLEHVADPEAALTHLAAVLPRGCDLLFSVPLHGRLEAVWGHLTVFDVARLQSMLNTAGLVVDHVEPVANQWTFVLASPEASGRARAENAIAKAPEIRYPALVAQYDFVVVPQEDLVARSGTADFTSEITTGKRVTFTLTAPTDPDTGEPAVGAFDFEVPGLTALRLDLALDEFDSVERMTVDLLSREKSQHSWVWEPTPEQLSHSDVRRIAFRAGTHTDLFEMVSSNSANEPIDKVRVTIQVPARHRAAMSVRAAYLP